MTVLQALAILEAGVLECKKRNIDTPEMREALGLFRTSHYPKWLVPQYRNNVLGRMDRTDAWELEGQQQVLRATFPGIRDCVRILLEVRMDRLALKFHETKDLNVRNEIYRLCRELIKLDEPWNFVVI